VQVWNPSFDVTPASLLTGIITEHGVIPRKGDVFPVQEFLRTKVH
jgi:methylthioribose-1-phosphate isomerase